MATRIFFCSACGAAQPVAEHLEPTAAPDDANPHGNIATGTRRQPPTPNFTDLHFKQKQPQAARTSAIAWIFMFFAMAAVGAGCWLFLTPSGKSLWEEVWETTVPAPNAVLPGREHSAPATPPILATAPIEMGDPLADLSVEERTALAEAVVFPNGRTMTTEDGSVIDFQPGVLVETPFATVLVNEGRIEGGHHVDSGHVAIHYLEPEGLGYRVMKAFPDAIQSGSLGSMGEMAISRKFSDLPVVYTEGGGTWQGSTCGWVQLTELQPSGPVELVSFMSDADIYDTDGIKMYSATGQITNIIKNRSFAVRFTGDMNFTAHYVRTGNTYVLQGGEADALQGC